jgi:hypothetical protein
MTKKTTSELIWIIKKINIDLKEGNQEKKESNFKKK